MMPKVHSIMGENTNMTNEKGVAHDILEQISGEEVMYKPFWDIEEKHTRDTWDERDHPDTKCKAFSPPTKILKRDKPVRHPADKQKEKHEKCPQPEKI